MGTYLRGGVHELLWEAVARKRWLFRERTQALEVKHRMQLAEAHLKDCFGVEWRGRTLLDVGCGQLLRNARYFGIWNSVIGIDRELPLRPPYVRSFMKILFRCGALRAVKTGMRQALGVDRRYLRAFSEIMDVESVPEPQTIWMDATAMAFPEATFDGAFSFSTFQHIEVPGTALSELRRVLKPGACAYLDLHLFTSLTGSDHPLLRAKPAAVPPWAHLRPSERLYNRYGLYVNRVRLAQWRALIASVFPTHELPVIEGERERAVALMTPPIRNELQAYDDDELLTTTFIAVVRR